jgi:hypothetical protein
MEKDVLQQIFKNPIISQIKDKINAINSFPDLKLTTRVCDDEKYGQIPIIKVNTNNIVNADYAQNIVYDAMNYIRNDQNILNYEQDITITFGKFSFINDPNIRVIDIYLKHMTQDKQIKTFHKLAKGFNNYLDILKSCTTYHEIRMKNLIEKRAQGIDFKIRKENLKKPFKISEFIQWKK